MRKTWFVTAEIPDEKAEGDEMDLVEEQIGDAFTTTVRPWGLANVTVVIAEGLSRALAIATSAQLVEELHARISGDPPTDNATING